MCSLTGNCSPSGALQASCPRARLVVTGGGVEVLASGYRGPSGENTAFHSVDGRFADLLADERRRDIHVVTADGLRAIELRVQLREDGEHWQMGRVERMHLCGPE